MTKALQLYCGEQSGTVRGPPVTFSTVSSYLIEKLGNQGSFDWYRSKLGVRPPRSWTIQEALFSNNNISRRPSTCSVLLEHQHLLTPLHLLCAITMLKHPADRLHCCGSQGQNHEFGKNFSHCTCNLPTSPANITCIQHG
jgi:hypothetical protein